VTNNFWRIFTDGGSRGNPGPSACSFIIYDPRNKIIHQQGFYIGVGTNNNAEYLGVLHAYRHISAQENIPPQLQFFLDSELVVKQLSGIYKIKDPNLQSIALEIKNYQKTHSVSYNHIPRSKNSAADLLVNQTLDNQ